MVGALRLERRAVSDRYTRAVSSEYAHLGVDAGTGRIVASTLTPKDVDDASQADPLNAIPRRSLSSGVR